ALIMPQNRTPLWDEQVSAGRRVIDIRRDLRGKMAFHIGINRGFDDAGQFRGPRRECICQCSGFWERSFDVVVHEQHRAWDLLGWLGLGWLLDDGGGSGRFAVLQGVDLGLHLGEHGPKLGQFRCGHVQGFGCRRFRLHLGLFVVHLRRGPAGVGTAFRDDAAARGAFVEGPDPGRESGATKQRQDQQDAPGMEACGWRPKGWSPRHGSTSAFVPTCLLRRRKAIRRASIFCHRTSATSRKSPPWPTTMIVSMAASVIAVLLLEAVAAPLPHVVAWERWMAAETVLGLVGLGAPPDTPSVPGRVRPG